MKKIFYLTILIFITTIITLDAQTCSDGTAAEVISLDLTGINTEGEFGTAGNENGTLTFPGGTQLTVVAYSYADVEINPNGASWCSEASVAFGGTVGISPGTGQDNAGPCNNPHNETTPQDLTAGGLSFPTNAVGEFVWEAYETFNDGTPDPDQTFGAGTITLYGCAVDAPLPVELTSFHGEVTDKSNMLMWETATEENTEMHVIERSIDGRGNWEVVGEVAAAGNSFEAQNYKLEDMNPVAQAYYRLKSVDFDGYTDYSEIIMLERKVEHFEVINIAPNPATESVNFSLETPESGLYTIKVSNMVGQTMYLEQVNLEAGILNKELNVSNYADGVYIITIENGFESLVHKIVKQ